MQLQMIQEQELDETAFFVVISIDISVTTK